MNSEQDGWPGAQRPRAFHVGSGWTGHDDGHGADAAGHRPAGEMYRQDDGPPHAAGWYSPGQERSRYPHGGEAYGPADGPGRYAPGGQPYWQPPGDPWPPGRYPPAPRKRRTGLIAGLIVGGVLIASAAAAGAFVLRPAREPVADKQPSAVPSPVPTVTSSTPPPAHSIVVPASFGDFTRMSGATANRTVANIRRQAKLRKAPGAFTKAKIGIYRRRAVAGPELLFFGLSAGTDPVIKRQLRSLSPSEVADSFFFGTHSKNYPAGSLGGVLRCGKNKVKGRTEAACVWVDDSVVGMVFDGRVPDPVALARTALSLRNAAER